MPKRSRFYGQPAGPALKRYRNNDSALFFLEPSHER
jgi:hypothetical protein